MVKFLLVVITLVVCFAVNFPISSQSSEQARIAKAGCKTHCGRVKVPFPFGIGHGCSIDEWFEIVCRRSTTHDANGDTPFLRKLDVEVLDIFTNGTLRVMNPITHQN
ncbi:hypothetical protein TIFTF001_024468 [Ficus carica]|uniref:Wall-associated receptor kinase galacturonan-binding domain-containing protein n=1 Tax=Ficus carica TaxID=3494 RepID=A0AA88DDB4_FICCA|nr:hypothetical protein TIFTF001_024468 [Ficus carica]